ncbi:MAG: hypothetical protein RMJ66_03100 [Bacteroidia bacterium]|nr:T9SS type A sorting domain-containing protein [Bacteroidia bacterium]MDW8134033.1 hypothetical protein [Bacteroidia bacterium]
MRYLHRILILAVLTGTGWAQSVLTTRVFKRKPEVEAHFKDIQWVRVEDGAPARPSSHHLRTTQFPPLIWLKPSQDADTVPTVASTLPEFAGDTLLANNAGQDIDQAVSSDCHHSFFDSLNAMGAWLIYSSNSQIPFFSNYLFPPSDMSPDELWYIGGGIAERYDIDPTPLIDVGGKLYIKGIAAQILNNFHTRSDPSACNPSTPAPSIDDGDGAYTITYQLWDTAEVNYLVDGSGNPPRIGSYPEDIIVEVKKPLSSVRIGYNRTEGQCVEQQINRLERLDYVYFDQPIEVKDSLRSIYVALRYELYVPGFDNINDTLFALIGPAYENGGTCRTGDTNYVGRNMMLVPGWRQSTAEWIYPNEWYPQFFIFAGRGYDLNHLLYPIVFGINDIGTGQVIHSGQQGFGLPYPNPAISCIHLELNTPAATQIHLSLYTPEGKLVQEWKRPVAAGESTVAIDIKDIPAGAYLLYARTPYGAATFWINIIQ